MLTYHRRRLLQVGATIVASSFVPWRWENDSTTQYKLWGASHERFYPCEHGDIEAGDVIMRDGKIRGVMWTEGDRRDGGKEIFVSHDDIDPRDVLRIEASRDPAYFAIYAKPKD